MREPPEHDAAPLAGGAGVNDPKSCRKSIPRTLIHPTHWNAPYQSPRVPKHPLRRRGNDFLAKVMAFLVHRGAHGATDHEGSAELRISVRHYTRLRDKLAALGLVVDSGRCRKTESGHAATVWVMSNHAPRLEEGAA